MKQFINDIISAYFIIGEILCFFTIFLLPVILFLIFNNPYWFLLFFITMPIIVVILDRL